MSDDYLPKEILSPANELLARVLEAISWASLGFRGAANAAVEVTKRPIKPRVLKRVNSARDFKALSLSTLRSCAPHVFELRDMSPEDALRKLANCLNDAELVEDQLLPEFYERLGRDSRFSTIVLEVIEAEKRWDDLWGTGFRSVWDRLRAGIEKVFDKDHPASRTAASLLLSGASLIIAYKVTPGLQDLQIPVRLDLVHPKDSLTVKLDLGSASQTVPIHFIAPDPVQVNFQPVIPVKLSITGSVDGKAGSKGVPTDVSRIVEKLGILNREIGDVSPLIRGDGTPQKDNLVSAVMSVATNLEDVSKSMTNLVNATDGNGKKLEFVGANLTSAELHARSFQGVVSSVQAATSIVVSESENGTVFLQWLDDNQEPTSCTVTAKISGTRGSKTLYSIGLSVDECSAVPTPLLEQVWKEPVVVGLNHPLRLGLNIPFHLILVGAEHPLFGKTRILLRFQPDATKAKAVTASSSIARQGSRPEK